jgi:hypothetical protein
MQSKSIWEYIMFGTSLRYLQDAREGWPVHKEEYVLQNIDWFLEKLQPFGLKVTARASFGLRALRDEFAKLDKEHKLTAQEAKKLGGIMNDLRNTLNAEARGIVAFVVTDKRLDVNRLLQDLRGLLAPKVFDAMPDIARYDFTEAGRCIAFERPTAAAFHLLRGTESVFRNYYCSIVRRNRVKPLLWGAMVESLGKCRKPPERPLLDNLDNIRRSFRNPTQHPEKVYDIEEVQDLFGLCVDVVNRMVGSNRWIPNCV